MKTIKRIILGLVILLVIVVLVLWMMIDSLAKAGVEKGGTYALGVDTKVDTLSLSLLSGQLTMNGLTIANPEGYKTEHLMKSGRFNLEIETGSVFTDTVRIPRFELDGLDVNIEQKLGKSNVGEVMDNVKKRSGSKEKGGKEFDIDLLVIRNVTAHVQVLPIGGKASTLTIKVPLIEMKNLTPENRKGIVMSELIAKLFPAIIGGVIDKGKGVLPAGMTADLTRHVEGLKKVFTLETGKKVMETGGKIIKDVGKDLEGVGKKLDDLFGGKKK